MLSALLLHTQTDAVRGRASVYIYIYIYMFHSREINNKINKLHYRALRIVYRDEISTFEELLKKDGSLTIHHRNLHLLATERYIKV